MKWKIVLISLVAFTTVSALSCSAKWCMDKHNLSQRALEKPGIKAIHERYQVTPLAVTDPRDIMGRGLLPQSGGDAQIANAECVSRKKGSTWKSIQSLTENQFNSIVNETEASFAYRDVEQLGLGMGVTAKVSKVLDIGIKAKYSDRLFYEMIINKQFRFSAPLSQHHAIVEGEENCADAARVCGTAFVGGLYCGTLQFAKLKKTAFEADGTLKIKIVDVGIKAGAEYFDEVGQLIEGCFLYEPMDYAFLSDACNNDGHYGLTFAGPVCKKELPEAEILAIEDGIERRDKTDEYIAKCIDEKFPEYDQSKDFEEGIQRYLKEYR